METPEDDDYEQEFGEKRSRKYKPIFSQEDRVIYTLNGIKTKGTVKMISLPPQMDEAIRNMKEVYGEEAISSTIKVFQERDPDCLSNPIYAILPDDWKGPASWEVAALICPTLTREQYNRIMGIEPRYFIVLESDLIPEDWES